MQSAKLRPGWLCNRMTWCFQRWPIFHGVYMTSTSCWSLVLLYQSTQVARVLAEVKDVDESSHADVTSV